mmetsp:Transcript_40395/g.86109  ORF Transcript_40395/g.86109 Transcript_40395/m.86109 type:complete len:223 (-) Transcript_40395:269-937(-)
MYVVFRQPRAWPHADRGCHEKRDLRRESRRGVCGRGAALADHQLRTRDRWNAHLRTEHLIDDAVVLGLLGCHEEVSVAIVLHLVDGLAGIVGNVLAKECADEEDLLGLDLDVGGLALGTAERLVDHDARVGQRATLALLAGTKQEGPHGRGGPKAHRINVARHVLHGVEDGHTSRDRAARRVDVQSDVLLCILVCKVEQLRDEQVGDLVIDLLAEEEDSITQ